MTAFEQQVEPQAEGEPVAGVAFDVGVDAAADGGDCDDGWVRRVSRRAPWAAEEILEAALGLILIVIVFNRFLPFVFFSRTKGEWLTRWVLLLRVLIYLVLPVTLILGFLQSVTALTREHSDQEPETQAEAVDALIEAGREEGILDESNRDLIQSVVQFSEKTVREAMKPRPEMVTVAADTSVERFIELLRVKPFSRVPVFEGSIDNIVGIVFAQDVLAGAGLRSPQPDRGFAHAQGCLLRAGNQAGDRLAARDAEEQSPHGDCD